MKMKWYFGFFLVSGFCSILYELVWLRLAMADFAVTTALVSIVLSVFMLGLGFGSWGAGYFIGKYGSRPDFPMLGGYGLAEFLIGISAIVVPHELLWGRAILEKIVTAHPISSPVVYLITGLWITFALVPWCACMGATFPLAMASIKYSLPDQSSRSFSYLYLANIFGAVLGSILPLILIEIFGFHGTLRAGAVLNFGLALCALMVMRGVKKQPNSMVPVGAKRSPASPCISESSKTWLLILFGTGLTSMGAEIVWVRLLTPWLGTVVYVFAAILAVYLMGTYFGSRTYRRSKETSELLSGVLLALLGFSVLLPLLACDPRLPLRALLRLAVAVAPFSFLSGMLTPMILDRMSGGDADRAGRGYAINILGCILGPLISGLVLLPWVGERMSLCILALPWLAAGLLWRAPKPADQSHQRRLSVSWKSSGCVIAALIVVVSTIGYENQFQPSIVLRDHTATVIATGTGMHKRLLVNGVGMTFLTPVTKMMVHTPLAFLPRQPERALIICFGMGTSYRSMLSWGIHTTAVELVPSVPRLFPYYYSRGAELLQSPLSEVVIDDGRRYLERSAGQFDVIAIDPPPPVEAAGSSLLYTKQFYAIAKRHLRDDGILQQWVGSPDPEIRSSMAKALQESFPYVRSFVSIENWGMHFLASKSPIPPLSADVLASRLPAAASADMLEWGPSQTAEQQFELLLNHEVPTSSVIQASPLAPVFDDDRPVNEYYLLRQSRLNPFLQEFEQHLFAQSIQK